MRSGPAVCLHGWTGIDCVDGAGMRTTKEEEVVILVELSLASWVDVTESEILREGEKGSREWVHGAGVWRDSRRAVADFFSANGLDQGCRVKRAV